MTKKMGVNAALNLFKTALSIIFPLITYPYISRILGVENLGKINYTASIVGYFSLIAALEFLPILLGKEVVLDLILRS